MNAVTNFAEVREALMARFKGGQNEVPTVILVKHISAEIFRDAQKGMSYEVGSKFTSCTLRFL